MRNLMVFVMALMVNLSLAHADLKSELEAQQSAGFDQVKGCTRIFNRSLVLRLCAAAGLGLAVKAEDVQEAEIGDIASVHYDCGGLNKAAQVYFKLKTGEIKSLDVQIGIKGGCVN